MHQLRIVSICIHNFLMRSFSSHFICDLPIDAFNAIVGPNLKKGFISTPPQVAVDFVYGSYAGKPHWRSDNWASYSKSISLGLSNFILINSLSTMTPVLVKKDALGLVCFGFSWPLFYFRIFLEPWVLGNFRFYVLLGFLDTSEYKFSLFNCCNALNSVLIGSVFIPITGLFCMWFTFRLTITLVVGSGFWIGLLTLRCPFVKQSLVLREF